MPLQTFTGEWDGSVLTVQTFTLCVNCGRVAPYNCTSHTGGCGKPIKLRLVEVQEPKGG